MIKLFSLKEEKAKEVTNGVASKPKIPPGLIRMQKGACRCRELPPRALLGAAPAHRQCGGRLPACVRLQRAGSLRQTAAHALAPACAQT